MKARPCQLRRSTSESNSSDPVLPGIGAMTACSMGLSRSFDQGRATRVGNSHEVLGFQLDISQSSERAIRNR